MFDSNIVKKQIDLLLAYGIKDFEITGGEPSECLNIREYCEYIKNKSPSSKIAIITNGGLYATDIWDLIDEVLLSYHVGQNMLGADISYFPNGCTYNKALKTVEMTQKFGKLLRINIVIGMFNINAIDSIIDDVIKFQPKIINFLPVNLFDEAKDQYSQINYDLIGPVIIKQLDRLNKELPLTLKFVRYIPFCVLSGYEKYIVGTFQHIFDWFDWNVELTGLRILKLINDKNALDKLGRYGSTSFLEADKYRNESYEKSIKCLKCKYLYICDGVEKTPDHSLLKYIKPCNGIFLKNINEFVGKQTENFYQKIYGN